MSELFMYISPATDSSTSSFPELIRDDTNSENSPTVILIGVEILNAPRLSVAFAVIEYAPFDGIVQFMEYGEGDVLSIPTEVPSTKNST